MDNYELITGVLALAMSGIAWLAVRTSQDCRARNAELRAIAFFATERLAELENRLADLARNDRSLVERVDRLAASERRVDPRGARQGFAEAIALSEYGASADQLVETCGLGPAEARLVEVLYRREDEEGESLSANDSFVGDQSALRRSMPPNI